MTDQTFPHLKFPSIEQFNDVFARETWEGSTERRTLRYRSKVKLHGACMGIAVFSCGTVQAQSAQLIVSPESDISGFAAFATPSFPSWATAAQSDEPIIFYGEWAGPKIAKGDAVQQIDKRRFFIFAVGLGIAPQDAKRSPTPRDMISCPADIESLIPSGIDRDLVRVLHYEEDLPQLTFDFSDEDQIDATLSTLNAAVERVGEVDPYISRSFGVDYRGEGYVQVQHGTLAAPLSYEAYSKTTFKAKTDRHRVRKQPKPATVREPLPQSAMELIDTFVTPQRVEQAIDQVCGGTPDIKATGKVIGWVTGDVEKEGGPEIEALGVPYARLKGDIATATRAIFMARLEALESA